MYHPFHALTLLSNIDKSVRHDLRHEFTGDTSTVLSIIDKTVEQKALPEITRCQNAPRGNYSLPTNPSLTLLSPGDKSVDQSTLLGSSSPQTASCLTLLPNIGKNVRHGTQQDIRRRIPAPFYQTLVKRESATRALASSINTFQRFMQKTAHTYFLASSSFRSCTPC